MNKFLIEKLKEAGFELPETWGKEDTEAITNFAKILTDISSEVVRQVFREGDFPLDVETMHHLQDRIKNSTYPDGY